MTFCNIAFPWRAFFFQTICESFCKSVLSPLLASAKPLPDEITRHFSPRYQSDNSDLCNLLLLFKTLASKSKKGFEYPLNLKYVNYGYRTRMDCALYDFTKSIVRWNFSIYDCLFLLTTAIECTQKFIIYQCFQKYYDYRVHCVN